MHIDHLVPVSKFSDIVWPAFSTGSAASVLGLQFQLQQSQWWTQEQLASLQLKQLALLLSHAKSHVPFFRERLQGLSWQADTPLSLNEWQQIPILSRRAVQAAGESLRSEAINPVHGSISEVHTSGSTGTPIKVSKTRVCELMFVAVRLGDHSWHRRDLMSKMAMLRTVSDGVAQYPQGVRYSGLGGTVDGLYPSGECVVLSITATIEQQLEWLQREQPKYLLAFPSVVAALAQHALQHEQQLPELQQVTTLGESMDASLRELCKQAFNAELVDTYSSQEIGYLALQCPDTENYHVQSEAVFIEVLDANDQPCKPGQVGRVIATPLHNYAMPLLRYELGDYAEVGEPCTCGRHLPVLKRILGRSRNILTLPNGDQLWPRLSELHYGEIAPIRQFQMVQKTPNSLEVKLVPKRAITAEEEAQLRALIVSRIGHPFAIKFSYHTDIPRSATGKYEDFRSEL